jgi:mannose-6-phosphate isomerase|tara:strand:+ start:435 stop:779 length:345 start_codon:yes stop_codon:yes gene_type:complete
MNYKENRPWGSFENLLDEDLCKVKKIIIKAGGAPSYQYHHKREEVWVVIQGDGELKLDDKVTKVSQSSIIHVPFKSKHQIRNTGSIDLIFIEIQRGSYFGEDDIVRLEDDYGRD